MLITHIIKLTKRNNNVKPENQIDLTIVKQIIELQNKSIKELDELWHKLFDHPPAVCSKAHMIGKLAYKIQELAYGGVDEQTEAKIRAAERDVNRPKKTLVKKYIPMIGTKIMKNYKGKTHEILVVNDGFAYEGAVYGSLSAIAQKITGTKWNGLKFFNIKE